LLFGETEKERRLRLRALELLDERDPKAAGTNEFRRALEEAEKAMEYREIEGRGKGKGKGREEDGDGEEDGHIAKRKKREEPAILDLELVKTEPKKVYPLIYYAIKVNSRLIITF
jgi:pre-mRNA-splicing factor 18